MSQHQPHASDRAAAYRGLILGAIVIAALLVTIVRLTNAHYSNSKEGAKAASTGMTGGALQTLDV
jgi:hypothetical protein